MTKISTGYPQTYPQPTPHAQSFWGTGFVWKYPAEEQLELFQAERGEGRDRWLFRYPERGVRRTPRP